MKIFSLLSLGCSLLLWACTTASIAPSEDQPSAQPTSEITPTLEAEPPQDIENPDNPCPDFHLTPQNLELPVEKISNAPQALHAMCSSPATGDLYLLTDTEVFHFDINTQRAQKVFENSPDFKKLIICAVDKQENLYLGDDETDQLFQYHNTNKTWTKLEQDIEGVGHLSISRYNSLQFSPQQKLFFSSPDSSRIFYYTHDLTPKLFELNYHANIEKFDIYSNRKQFAERSLNTIKNTVMTVPSSITFDPKQMFIGSDDGWREIFSVNLTSGEISSLPSVAQRGKKSFIEKSNPIGIWNLNYSPRYQVLFQGYGIPTWTSPETGCWQGLSSQIKPAGLAEGGDGHLYIIDSPTKTLHRIQLSPEIFKASATQAEAIE